MAFDTLDPHSKTRMQRLTSNLTVLVADDDYRFRRHLIEKIVQPLQFKRLIQTSDGTEAWEFFQTWRADIIFADFDMPGMCGTELLHHCVDFNRAAGIWPPVGIIISRYEDVVAIKELLHGVQMQSIAKNTLYRLLGLPPNLSDPTLPPLDAQEKALFWDTILHTLQWASRLKK